MRERARARLAHGLAGLALLAGAVALIAASDRHPRLLDLTREARYSLHEKSIEVLALLPGTVQVTAFLPADPTLRAGLADFFARYQRHKPDLRLAIVDPREDPARARRLDARLGEVVITYHGRTERVARLRDSEVTTALARLARGGDRFVAFLANNGERRVAREANHDLSRFAARLEARGLALREYTLGTTGAVPANTAVLVIASPSVAYLPSELDAVTDYLARGGNLLWLTEPDAAPAARTLEHVLGVRKLPGTVVDPIGLTKLRNPTYAVAFDYAPHPVTEGFNQTVAFPYASAFAPDPASPWTVATLAHTGPEAWTETGPLEGNVSFDGDDEVQGELAVALALTRPAPASGGEQRVVVIGDGDFLSNLFVDNLGNLEFGRRVVEWLAADDELIDIDVPAVPDAHLDLSMPQRITMFLFFGVALPLAFALNALLLWWRTRHA